MCGGICAQTEAQMMSLWLSRGSWPILWGRLWGGLRVPAHMHVTVPAAQRPLSNSCHYILHITRGITKRRTISVTFLVFYSSYWRQTMTSQLLHHRPTNLPLFVYHDALSFAMLLC